MSSVSAFSDRFGSPARPIQVAGGKLPEFSEGWLEKALLLVLKKQCLFRDMSKTLLSQYVFLINGPTKQFFNPNSFLSFEDKAIEASSKHQLIF